MGKSRLVYEFVHAHRTHGWLVLESASVSYGKATPYFPVIDLLKRYVHLDDDDEPRTIRAKVTGQVLTLDEALQETIPALLGLLDALPEDSPFLQLDPPQRRQRTLEALKRLLLRESQVQPLLLVFEDLHWIDTETQALLDSLIESLPTAQLLLLVNYRPEYQHGWGSKTFYTQLRLDPLPPASAGGVAPGPGGRGCQPGAAQAAPDRAHRWQSLFPGGERPHSSGDPGAGGRAWCLSPGAGPPDRFRCRPRCRRCWPPVSTACPPRRSACSRPPPSLAQRSLSLCCTPLPSCPRRRCIAASRTSRQPSSSTRRASSPSASTPSSTPSPTRWLYGSLLQERRRVLHARIVEALETLYPGIAWPSRSNGWRTTPCGARCGTRLWRTVRQAGRRPLARSAYREAVGYFEQALSALPHLPEQRDTREQAIDLRLALRTALLPSGDSGRILAYLREAEALAEALDDPRRLGQVSRFLSLYF